MNKTLNAFLNPIKSENDRVVISKRFQEEGNPVKWEVRPIMNDENDNLIKKHTKKDKRGNQVFDRVSYMNELIASSVVFPDLKDAELQKAYGVMGEAQLLSKMLLVGEYASLAEAVQRISGLDVDEDLVDEAKNS